MRGALIVSIAFLPGLCEKAEDPSKGVPPVVWQLRQVMEKELTKGEQGEYVTPEQAERFRDAADEVATFANVRDNDVAAEVVYLLPRSWQWPQRQTLRDLLVVLGASKAGPVLAAEELRGGETDFRKAAMLAIISLHKELAPMPAAERVKRVLGEAGSGAWDDKKFGWRSDLMWEYGSMALANDPAESVSMLKEISGKESPLRAWALTTLARTGDPAATGALNAFYLAAADPLAAAFRFYSAIRRWPEDLEVAVLVPGATFPLLPLAAKAVALDRAAWDARAADPVRLKLGVEEESLGRKAFVDDGDRASVVIAEVVNRKPGDPDGATSEAWLHFRLRKRAGIWVVARWSRTGP